MAVDRVIRLVAQFLVLSCAISATSYSAEPEAARIETLRRQLHPYYSPPAEFAGEFGGFRSPLAFDDGSVAASPADWSRRRLEILASWRQRLGGWPEPLARPAMKTLRSEAHDSYLERRVSVLISDHGDAVEGFLLTPNGEGPFPAVLVPFYEPHTSLGRGEVGQGTHDYGIQLVRRGFVTLSIGTPGWTFADGGDTRELLTAAGDREGRQPLVQLASTAANCRTALAQLPEVDPARIGVVGLSYGGKWAMFASCLDERFACAVWSDPGIVFNESDSNVNYWEPWYLGYDPEARRRPGVPSEENPRTGLYRDMIAAGEDLVSLHALMAPRPVLVSGGVQDPPRNWVALNHLVAVNDLLGNANRVALTARETHRPTPEALDLELAFLEYWLKYSPPQVETTLDAPN